MTGGWLRDVKTGQSETSLARASSFRGPYLPNTDLVELVEAGRAWTLRWTCRCASSLPGLFACGDNRSQAMRQLACSCGDGVTAALAARKYIEDTFAD
ncbi:hypothetical protein HS125_09005 [bacterium]|nr:hypothetical protein [bacterium]